MWWRSDPYSADSQHWEDPDTCRGIWHRTRSSACLAGRYPKAAPRIHSSRWGWWLSTPQSCVAWWKRWGRSEPAGSFYKRDFSENKTKTRWDVLVGHQQWLQVRRYWTEVRKPTSSSLPRVVDAMAEVIPALREFWTRDWEQEGEWKVFVFECELNNGLHIYVSLRAKIALTIAWWDQAEIKQDRRETKMGGYFRNFKQQAVFKNHWVCELQWQLRPKLY